MSDEPRLFPATYRAPLKKCVKPLITGLSTALLAMFGRGHMTLSSLVWLWIFAVYCLGMFVLYTLNECLCRVTLYEDRIEKQTWWDKQSWRREEVARICAGPRRGFSLVHRYNSGYYFMVPDGIERDAAWNTWLAGIPEDVRGPPLRKRIARWFRGKG